ncbi:protein CHROMATIN REMODELING 24-like [Triticum dicoccoides]|nr:protein CHROMATIN REMODELING 24-like [Triticum dicoccoides]
MTYIITLTNLSKEVENHHHIDGDEEKEEEDWRRTLRWGPPLYRLPGRVFKMLYAHQHDGLSWLWSLHCRGTGGILGDDMGLGKTMQKMWAIFNFCCPEAMGDEEEFRTRYQRPISRGNDKTASNREKHIRSNAAKELRERIKPNFLRRMKSEVSLETGLTDDKKLPKKDELIIWLKLTDCQRRLYEAFLNSELVQFESEGNPLAALNVLKKICDHPLICTQRAAGDILEGMDGDFSTQDIVMVEKMAMNLADMAHDDDAVQFSQEVSCKLSFILSLLPNLLEEGHNVLIFSQTCKMLNLIQEAIILEGYDFSRMDGGITDISERERIVKDFQEGYGGQIFLLTTKVGGLGLTLTKAARVILVDPAWNPSTDNQSVDWVDRIGQTKEVIVYRLMTSATVEEKMYKSQVLKGGLFRAATEKKEQRRYFSQSDLWELFSMPEQGFDVSLTQKQLQEEHGQQLDMDESLREHIQFLEKQGIAGVSHHSLLFSETEILPMLSENDAPGRGAHGKPKVEGVTARTHLAGKNTDSDIPEEINWLSETLASTTLEPSLPQCGDGTHGLDDKSWR